MKLHEWDKRTLIVVKHFRVASALILSLVLITSVNADDSLSDSVGYSIPEYTNLVYNSGLTMPSGVENIVAFNHLSAVAVDRVIHNRWFTEDRLLHKAGNITGRAIKNIFLDDPLDYFAVVYAHEYFGHGARYREFSIDDVEYSFEAPPPYGSGGGAASTSIDGSTISNDELMTILNAGIASQIMINRRLSMRWVARKEIQYREASLYFESFRIMWDYIDGTPDELPFGNIGGKDPGEYLVLLNEKNGYPDPDNPRMTVDDLRKRNLYNFMSPFGWYSVYVRFKTYVIDGNTAAALPMIPLGEVDYLPSFRVGYTPFGPDYHIENYVRIGSRVGLLDLRIGDQTFHSSWRGVGLAIQNVIQRPRLSVDVTLDAWNQPGIELKRNTTAFKGDGTGGAFSFAGHYDLTNKPNNKIAGYLQLGYKSAGYLEGYDLDASPIFLIGLSYTN